MSNMDRFQSAYHNRHFPDSQDKEVTEYSTCAGCGEIVTLDEVMSGDILDVFGMCVHDNRICMKIATHARTVTMDEVISKE